MTVTPDALDEFNPLIHDDGDGTPKAAADVQNAAFTSLTAPTMSEPRNRSLAPPPPRHPAARPPSPNLHPRPNNLNTPPPPIHPSQPPLPSRPPPSPQPDARPDYSGPEPIPFQVAPPLDVSYTPHVQRQPPPVLPDRPGNPRSFSDNVVASTPNLDVKPAGNSISPELPPPVSRTSSYNSITGSPAIPPPLHHARKERSNTLDSAYEATLSEKELRDLYDDEEIDRFLRLFSAVGSSSLCCRRIDSSSPQRVNEVKLNDGGQSTANADFSAATGGIAVEDPEDNDDKDWVSLKGVDENLGLPHDGGQPQTISEQIAQVSAARPHSANS